MVPFTDFHIYTIKPSQFICIVRLVKSKCFLYNFSHKPAGRGDPGGHSSVPRAEKSANPAGIRAVCFFSAFNAFRHIFFFNVHQYNIVSHLADVTERYHIFLLPSQKPHMQPGPGTIRASRQPVSMSKSTSPTNPRRLQVFTLITSFV